MIVKVQVALFSSEPTHPHNALVYDQAREHQTDQLVPAPAIDALRKTNKGKGFFHADWNGKYWAVGAPAEWQTW
jgi:hypothetical protein